MIQTQNTLTTLWMMIDVCAVATELEVNGDVLAVARMAAAAAASSPAVYQDQ